MKTSEFTNKARPVAVIGAGSIGLGFALMAARAGYAVRAQDPDPKRRVAAADTIAARLSELKRYDLLDEDADAIAKRISFHAEVAEAVDKAFYVQECAPEDLALKREVFSNLDKLSPADAVIASSTSALPASKLATHVPGKARCLVCHPANPPFLMPVIEIVPAPFTAATTVEISREFLTRCGFSPVVVYHEPEGFAFNRLQGALLREAYCLVRDGVVTVDEVDRLVRDGLGLRWSFMGPFETSDLNHRGGIASHVGKMGAAYERMGAERGQRDPWTPELVAKVVEQRRAVMTLDKWEERNAWRDSRLMALVQHRRTQPK